MTATYDPSLPTNRDHLRQLLGDTDTASPLLQDETIDAKLQAFGFTEALAQLADGLASELSQRPDSFKEDGGVEYSWQHRVVQWRELATKARSGLIMPPHAQSAPRNRLVSAGQTTIQQQSAKIPLPGYLPPGPFGGFRPN